MVHYQSDNKETCPNQEGKKIFLSLPVPMGMMVAAVRMGMVVMSAAAIFMVMMVMPTPLFMVMLVATGARTVMGMGLPVSGKDFRIPFHSAGNGSQFRDQSIRILRSNSQLPGGKGDGSLLNLRMVIEFFFDFGSAVGAVQVFYEIDLPLHKNPPQLLIN